MYLNLALKAQYLDFMYANSPCNGSEAWDQLIDPATGLSELKL